MSERTLICAGNWKAHGDLDLLDSWGKGMSGVAGNVVLCVPHPLLIPATQKLEGSAQVGAQDVADHPPANQTGNTTAQLVVSCGITWTLIGHSERRANGETNEQIVEKVKQASKAGLKIILCIGETLDERKAGKLEEVITTQLAAVFDEGVSAHMVIAYEPVWAIGTGVAASANEAQDACKFTRSAVGKYVDGAKISVLYGGSVKPENVDELVTQPDIDGVLVGGASLDHELFRPIANSVATAKN